MMLAGRSGWRPVLWLADPLGRCYPTTTLVVDLQAVQRRQRLIVRSARVWLNRLDATYRSGPARGIVVPWVGLGLGDLAAVFDRYFVVGFFTPETLAGLVAFYVLNPAGPSPHELAEASWLARLGTFALVAFGIALMLYGLWCRAVKVAENPPVGGAIRSASLRRPRRSA